jgi:hypothetical protein
VDVDDADVGVGIKGSAILYMKAFGACIEDVSGANVLPGIPALNSYGLLNKGALVGVGRYGMDISNVAVDGSVCGSLTGASIAGASRGLVPGTTCLMYSV